jgi:hypothetical protein
VFKEPVFRLGEPAETFLVLKNLKDFKGHPLENSSGALNSTYKLKRIMKQCLIPLA